MAFWNRKKDRSGRAAYVFVYTTVEGRQKPLPRSVTKHLDGEPDHNIQAWVDQYHLQYEKARIQADSLLFHSDDLTKYVDDYTAYRATRGKSELMLKSQRKLLLEYAIPFFLRNDPPLKDPNQWPAVASKLLAHLQGKGLSVSRIQHCNIALRKFWLWLQEERIVLGGQKLLLRAPMVVASRTPLKVLLTPNEVIAFAKQAPADIKLMALIGFFFSLRPQEILALRKVDFRAGALAEQLECCKAMKKVVPEEYSKLVVNITRQRIITRGEIKKPKVDSVGWVSCFSKDAATLIVDALRGLQPDAFVIAKHQPDWNLKRWARHGIKDVTLKDLRRASLYWLGHKAGMELIPLKANARHKRFETTALYVRVPEEAVAEYQELDLDT